ncbi:MAG: transglycosylase SLT domain-containing protein [Chloroflexota bacterium]|nr:MAG: transglycosylase SLT domain-containing protein [Chloroflexota bacterium]
MSLLVTNVHGQTLLFILIALLVGGALLLVVPQLSASSLDEVTGGTALNAEESLAEMPIGTVQELAVEATPDFQVIATGISPIFTREVHHWAPKILQWSEQYALDPDIIATIMQIESCGDPGASSHAGAQGLFQVMPFHFDPSEDMLDPDTNARRGMAFYNRQLEYTGQDIYLSFAGYNGGYAASGSSYPYWANETQRYYTWAKGIYDEAKAGMTESPTLQHWLAAGGGGGCQRAAQRLGL